MTAEQRVNLAAHLDAVGEPLAAALIRGGAGLRYEPGDGTVGDLTPAEAAQAIADGSIVVVIPQAEVAA